MAATTCSPARRAVDSPWSFTKTWELVDFGTPRWWQSVRHALWKDLLTTLSWYRWTQHEQTQDRAAGIVRARQSVRWKLLSLQKILSKIQETNIPPARLPSLLDFSLRRYERCCTSQVRMRAITRFMQTILPAATASLGGSSIYPNNPERCSADGSPMFSPSYGAGAAEMLSPCSTELAPRKAITRWIVALFMTWPFLVLKLLKDRICGVRW